MAELFDLQNEIRARAVRNIETLEIVTDLIASTVHRVEPHGRISANAAECLEAYLHFAPTERLRDLLCLLRLPEPDRFSEDAGLAA